MSSPISFGQVAQLVKKLEQVGWDAKRISKLGQATSKQFRAIESVLDGKNISSVKDENYLRLLETVNLGPTNGSHTIAESAEIFTGSVDPNFRLWGTNTGDNFTLETKVDVYEVIKDGDYRTLFGSPDDPYSLCLTQGQIVELARTHRHLLRQHGYGTFFLFQVNSELLIASVYFDGGQLHVSAHRFDDGRIWHTRRCHRLVVPQQTV